MLNFSVFSSLYPIYYLVISCNYSDNLFINIPPGRCSKNTLKNSPTLTLIHLLFCWHRKDIIFAIRAFVRVPSYCFILDLLFPNSRNHNGTYKHEQIVDYARCLCEDKIEKLREKTWRAPERQRRATFLVKTQILNPLYRVRGTHTTETLFNKN